MAFVKKRGAKLYLQWYDPIMKKVQSKSLGLDDSKSNRKKAENYAIKLQRELNKESQKIKELDLKHTNLESAFQHFLRNNQHKNPKTIKDYKRFYKKFTVKFSPDMDCLLINKLDVEDWLNDIKQLDLAKNTIHGYGKQLTHFLNFLFEYNYTPMFKINKEVKTKPEVIEKIIFSDEDISKIFKGLKNKNSNFITTVYLLGYTGLRSSDAISIKKENVDLTNRILRYYSPKRKVYREIAFHTKLVPILRKRMNEVKEENIIGYKNIENLGRAIKRYFSDLELSDKYTARTFRKTFITFCRSKYNMDATVVKELVGHAHTNTTDKYYNEVSIPRMKEELKKFKPLK